MSKKTMQLKYLLLVALLTLSCNGGSKPISTPKPRPTEQPTVAPIPKATPRPRLTLQPLPVTYQPSDSACIVNDDLAVKIRECQQQGAKEILINSSNELREGIELVKGQTLTIGKGVRVTSRTVGIPIRLKEESTIRGMGWDSIITESDQQGQWTVIAGYFGTAVNGQRDAFVTVRDLKVEGYPGKSFNSTPQAISLGNCLGCMVENVWVDGTHSIGAQYGGGGMLRYYASESRMYHILLTRVASQSVACVNCEDVSFDTIYVIKPGLQGGPGATSIDLEANASDDRLRNITIRNIYIDHRDSETSPTGNGILVQATATENAENVLVEDAVIIGGKNSSEPPITNVLSNALYSIAFRSVTFRRVQVSRTGQSCVRLDGVQDAIVEDVMCEDVGGGGTEGFYGNFLGGTNRISRVSFWYTGDGPVDSRMIIKGGVELNQITGWVME